MSIRILHLAYDPVLLQTRDKILRQNDMDPVSVLGNQGLEAMPAEEIRGFDAVLLGHAATPEVRRRAMAILRSIQEDLPIVALKSYAFETPLEGANFCVVADEAAEWVEALKLCQQK